jgi:low affinity Fe/Cu permease
VDFGSLGSSEERVDRAGSSNSIAEGRVVNDWFRRFASRTADVVGRSYAFILAVGVLCIWASTGPLFHFSDTWQLVINTGTTIVTFLMVFLIQNTQNRDAHAIHLKLDELIRANKNARNSLLALESMSDDELVTLQREFEQLRDRVAEARNVAAQSARRRSGAATTPRGT